MEKMKSKEAKKAPKVFALSKKCPLCGNTAYLRMTAEEEEQWADYTCYGGLIQEKLPDIDPQKREFIKNGYCPDCQEHLFDAKYDRSDFIVVQKDEQPEDVQKFAEKVSSMSPMEAIRSEFADLLTLEHKVVFLSELDMEDELYVDESGHIREREKKEEE